MEPVEVSANSHTMHAGSSSDHLRDPALNERPQTPSDDSDTNIKSESVITHFVSHKVECEPGLVELTQLHEDSQTPGVTAGDLGSKTITELEQFYDDDSNQRQDVQTSEPTADDSWNTPESSASEKFFVIKTKTFSDLESSSTLLKESDVSVTSEPELEPADTEDRSDSETEDSVTQKEAPSDSEARAQREAERDTFDSENESAAKHAPITATRRSGPQDLRRISRLEEVCRFACRHIPQNVQSCSQIWSFCSVTYSWSIHFCFCSFDFLLVFWIYEQIR